MKLHLPLTLRASLLTCLTAAAGLFATVGTGTLIVGSVVMTAASSSVALAEWAPADIAYTGTATIDAASTETLTLTGNTALTYTYAGTAGPIAAAGFDIKLVANNTADGASVQMNFQSSPITANSVWFSQGRFQINSNDVVANAGTLYAQGGQLYVNASIGNAITIGSSTYAENDATVSGAALRIEQGKTLTGSITLVEDAAITVHQGTATITGAIATAGNEFEKKGAGTLVFAGANTNLFDSLALNGGVLRSTSGLDNIAISVTSLDVKANSTLAHTGWNSIWTMGEFTSSAAESGSITLTLDNHGEHFFRQQYIFNGATVLDDSKLFDGTIDVMRSATVNQGNYGNWQIEMHAGSATQLSRAVVNLNNYAILAITAENVELEGLTSTNANAYVFSGANTDTTRTNSSNNSATPLYTTDGAVRTLTLGGNGDYSYLGTIAGNLIIEKTGTGLQTLGTLGDNTTINLHAGSLTLKGLVGANTQIHTEAGTSVNVPWKLTNEGDIYTATYARPDYVTGEGKVETGMIAAVGDTSYATNDAKYTKLAVGDYAGDSATIVSGLVTLITGNTNDPGDLADFGNIQTFILDGGGFILPTSTDREFVFDKNIVLQGDGFLRSWGEGDTTSTLRLTGAISGNGKLTKTDGGTITLAGNMSEFTGGVVIGKGGLIFDTDATLTSLEMYNNASLGVTGGHHVTLVSSTDAPWVPKAGTFSFKFEDGGDFSTHRIQFSNATTLNLTSDTHGSLTVNGLQCADTGNTNIHVGAHTALNVTGNSSSSNYNNFTKHNTFLLTHWRSKAAIIVEGTLNMLNHGQFAAVNTSQGSPTINVMDGGILNLKGLDVLWRDGASANGLIVTLAQGSAMHLGSGGISTAGGFTLTLNGGTIGILNSTTAWTSSKDLTLSGDVVVDTRLYTAATDGTAGTYSTAGGTITLSGAITGDGKLIKAGNGTLNLANVNKLDVQGGFVGMTGQLTINELTAMTAGGGRFLVDLGTDSVVANTYSGPVNLTLNAATAGSYIVFTGSAALQKENVDFDIFLDRGLTFDAATGLIVSNGQVSVTIGGEATTERYNLVWAGDAGEVWSNTTVQAWTGADDQRFSTGDSVTFDGNGIKEITIEGIVTPGAITVTGETDYAFSGGSITGEGALTKSGTGMLTLQTDLSDWSGVVNLDGGTIAFAGTLGTGVINVSGTSELSWLKGNVTDLSSRLRIANGSQVTFSIEEGDTVIFNTVLNPLQNGDTATFTKKGLGTLQITKNNALYGDIIVAEGMLDIGSTNYAKSLSLTGANASLATTGKVSIGAGQTLTVTATGTVVNAALDLGGGSLNLGDMSAESHAVGLGGNSLTLSTTDKTNLSLTLADDLAAGTVIDLFSNVSGLLEGETELTLGADSLLSNYFNIEGIAALNNAKLQFVNGSLQIVLARETNALVYGLGDNGVWKAGTAFDSGGTLFTDEVNVEFGAIAEGDSMTVQLGGVINAGSITIDAGEGKTYSFVQEEEADPAGSLTAFNGMTITSGTADFAAGTLQPGTDATITVNGGTLSLQNGATNDHVSITLGEGATLRWGTDNTTDYAAGSKLTIRDNAHVTFDTNGNRVVLGQSPGSGVNGSKGHVTLAGGGLIIGDGSVLHGTIDLGGQSLRLNESGSAYDLNITGNGDLIVRGNVTLSGANDFTGTLHIGDKTDAEGLNGSPGNPLNATLTVTDASLGNVTAIELIAGADGTGSTMNYSASADAAIDADITGTGNVNFSGGHEITLSGANDYEGKTGIGADTTLKVTDTTLSSRTEIGNAGEAGGTLYLTNTKADEAFDFSHKVGDGVSVTVDGGTINWLTEAGHEKTYTGTTTIAANTTVTATGPLTTGENSKIVLNDATSTLKLDLTAAGMPTWTTGHTVSGAGTLELNGTGQIITGSALLSLIDASAGASTLGNMKLTGGTLDITSEGQKTYLGKVQSLVIEAGAQLQVRSKGLQDQAGLTLSLAGAGTGEEGTATAAALYIGTGGSPTAVLGPVTRDISLAEDATAYVEADITGTLSGSFTGNGHTFTKTGAGTLAFTRAAGLDTGSFAVNAGSLQFRADASATFGRVDLAAGATLSFYNGANKDNKLTVSNLSLSGDATVQTTNFAGSILVDNLTGAGQTLTIDGASSATKMQFVIVQGGAFSGTIDVKQSNTGIERTLVFGATSADTLANAVVKLSQRASGSGNRLLAFAVGGEADGTIKIAGLEGIAESTVISTNTFNRDNITAETLADGNARRLEITGAGGTFSGSIGGKLTVDMNGSGTQTLAGILADDSHYVATQGKLALSGTNQTGTHIFKANGGTLDMSGYTRAADTTGKDTFAYSSGSIDNLHLTSGMEITAGEGFTGSIQLGGSTVLDGGALHFELSGVDPERQDLSTYYTIGTTGSLSLGDSGEKTYLYFNPEENTLDPSDEKAGKDYVLIANVGDAFDGVVNLEDILGHNMSTEGRANYTLKIDTLSNGQKNLVLTVSGSAATLTWSGASGGIWNTSSDNLVWTDGTDTMSFMDDDKVHFGTMVSAQTIQIAEEGVRMGGMTVTGETDYTFNGGAITSSSARGGLKVGTLDDNVAGTTGELFTGTLTINTANTYLGQTEINSGTVVAGNVASLSNTALSLNGGALHLNFEGTLGTSDVTMNGGELSALLDASVSNLTIAGVDTAKILAAAAGKTLTLTTANGTIEGALTIGTADKTGTVRFDIGTRSLTTAQDITISGRLQLDGTTGSFTGTQVALDGGDLHLTGGLTATLAGLSGSGKAIVDASTLAFSTTADTSVQIDARNAVIHGMEGTLSLGNLNLLSGTTALTGTVILNGITEGADTTLAIGKNGGNSGNTTLGAGVTTLANVMLAQGTLTVKDGDSLTFIESHGNVTTASAGESTLTIGAAWLKNGSSIDSKMAVTFTGSETLAGEKAVSLLGDLETGENTTLGDVTVDIRHGAVEVGVRPSNVNLAGNVELSSLLIKRGSVGIYSNIATVTNGITLAGTEATLNMRNLNPKAGITLQQGSLSNADNYTGIVTIDDVSTTGTSFAMGGLTDKATVVLAQFGQGSQLTGLGSLKLGNSTIQLSQGMDPAFKMNNTATGTVGIADGATVTFAVGSILGDVLKNGSGSYSVTDGSLSGLIDGDAFKNGVLFDEALTLHNIKAEVQGGNLVFTQLIPNNDTTYISSEEGQDINSYDAMDGFTKVIVDVNTAIDLTEAAPSPEQAADGLILKNLAGGSDLSVLGGEDDKITLNNNVSSTGFDGSISIDTAELQIRNTDALGDGSDPSQRELTIRGTLASTGLVTITNGKLTLDGNGNSLDGGLTIIDQDGDKGQLTVNGGTALGGFIQGGNGNTADILVGQGATVSLKHGTTLQARMSGSNAEKLAVADDATVTFGDGAHVEGMSLNLGKNASATIETMAGDLLFNGLNGTGALVGETGAQLDLNLAGGSTAVFNGDLSAYEGRIAVSGEGSQVIAASAENASFDIRGGKLTFRNDSADASSVRSYGATTLQGGSLHFDTRAVDNDGVLVNRGIKLASLTTQAPVLRSTTSNTLVFDMSLTNDLQNNALVTVANNSGQLAQGTVIEVNIHGIAANFTFTPGEDMSFTLLDGLDGTLTNAERDLSFNSLQSALNKYFSQTSLEFTNDNHTLVLTGTAISADEMRYHQNAATTETGRAGGALLDNLFVSSNPQGTAPGSLAANVLTAMEGIIASGDKAQADRVLSGIAGSTVTSLSASFAAGFDARLTSIRNRMTGMGVDQTLVNEDMPYFHAWISADGANTSLDADSTFAGYKLNSWGGTVGVDVDVNEYLTLGAAFTASYGDLTADGAEAADGNLDTYTVALFAHAQVKRWTHDIVLAVSTADASLDRTVDYGAGNYTAKGSTNGFGFGALYELAYNIPVGEGEDGIFSPLFRASFTRVSVDGYTETGAESMGLAVGKQDVSYATFGLGARYVAAVGGNVFNRTATLELRAMVLQDAGDRRGEADVALNGSTGRTRTVKGAEPGSTGIQVGASLNIPIEETSAIFADVNLDARSKTTTVSGSVGYRINF